MRVPGEVGYKAVPVDIEASYVDAVAAPAPPPPPPPVKSFYEVWGVTIWTVGLFVSFLSIYIALVAVSALAANRADNAPQTFLNNPLASNNGWTKHVVDSGTMSTDTPAHLEGNPLTASSMLRLEMSISSFNPLPSGATAQVTYRIVLPPSWKPVSEADWVGTFKDTVNCYVGSSFITFGLGVTGDKATVVDNNFKFTTGSVLKYPFDSYSTFVSAYCTYVTPADTKATPPIDFSTGILNFVLAIDQSDVGVFQQSVTYMPPVVVSFTDDYTGTIPYSELQYAQLKYKFTRSPIFVVFPMYIICAMWLIVISHTFVFYPFFIGKKKVDANGTVTGAVGVLFALPNIRNTMPGVPPLGAVMDFACYFWCLVIAITNFIWVATLWLDYTTINPPPPAADKKK